MAAVLDALAPYVKKLIADMAQEEVSMLLGVSGEITKLEENMESIKAFLADAERRHITDQSVKKWVRKLKDAMYDATDILDLCQLEADERREAERGGSMEQNNQLAACWQPLLACLENHPILALITCRGNEKMLDFLGRLFFCLRNPVFAHQIGSRIQELNQRLDEIYKGAAKFNFITNLSSYQDQRMMLPDAQQRSSLRTMSEFDETAIVGENIERDTKELVQMLIANDNHNLKVVSIIGMGGMGKTTLAQKILKEATIQEHFKTRIWLSITQHFDEGELLRTAITHAWGHHGGEQDKSKLVQTLTNTLSENKFMLVMDDVWSENSWNHVLSVPIKNACRKQPGSRILVTTRFEDLALKMQTPSVHRHHVRPLNEEDAWTLLKKQLPLDQVEINRLRSVGMEILKRCDGLPLAIKVIGGVLSTKYPSENEWKAVLNDPAWSINGLPEELDKRLYLSYEDLQPPQLKQCFLYCTLFPKGTTIPLTVVTSMWISEGFIQPPERSGSSHDDHLEDIATGYYWDLIKRNLIQPEEGYSLTGYMCTLHDVIRSFAEYMAREEVLVVRDDEQGAAADSGSGLVLRRLSTAPTVVPDWATLKKQKSLRTLAIQGYYKKFMPADYSLANFSNLRVLYILGTDLDVLVDSLCHLKHLRFLHLDETNISRLPDGIHKMKFLEYITLLDCKKLDHLPSSIVKLVHLRSLVITGSNVSTVPKGFAGLTNLRALYGFPVDVDLDAGTSSWCSLQELVPLSRLRKLTLYGLEKVHASWMSEEAMISSKGHLSYLRLNYGSASGHTTGPCGDHQAEQLQQQSVIEEVLEKLRPPTCIENLGVQGGYIGRQLPNWMGALASMDFKSLRFLVLENLLCCTQLPDGLRCLPSLESLNIKHAPAVKCIGPEFQASPSSLAAAGVHYSATTSAQPFPKLRHMELIGLCEWEEWEWNDDTDEEVQGDAVKAAIAMPFLEELRIDNCKLSCLPPGLANSNRHALRELYLYELNNLTYVENFPSVVKLDVLDCPELKRISCLSRLHTIRIVRCPNVEVLEGVPSLDSLVLRDTTMEGLPEYLQTVHPRFLGLDCSKKLCESLSPGSSEWNKISHIRKHNIVALRLRRRVAGILFR